MAKHDLGKQLKELRKSKKWTLEELSNKTSIPKVTLSRYENNLRRPVVDNLETLAKIFEVDINFLLGEDGLRTNFSNSNIKKIDRDDKRLSIKFTFNDPNSDETVEYFFKMYQTDNHLSTVHGAQFSIKIVNVVSTPNNATIERIIDNLATPIYIDRNGSKFTDFSVLLQTQIHQLLSSYLYINNDIIIIENENVNSEIQIEYPVAFTIYSMTGDYLGMTSFLYKFQDPNSISS